MKKIGFKVKTKVTGTGNNSNIDFNTVMETHSQTFHECLEKFNAMLDEMNYKAVLSEVEEERKNQRQNGTAYGVSGVCEDCPYRTHERKDEQVYDDLMDELF